MNLKKQIKEKKNQIKNEELDKYHKRTAKIDQKIDKAMNKLDQKAADSRKVAGFKLYKRSWVRGILWLLQFWLEVGIGFSVTLYLASSILPMIGNNIGHALGLTTEASLIDQVNLMFLPTAFVGIILIVCDLIFLKWLWSKMNKYLGRIRRNSFEKDLKGL